MSGHKSNKATMPSDISDHKTFFDRFATGASDFASKAWFFAACLILVLLWAPSVFLFPSIDTWQLVINTVTTIVTFLLVALLQNTQARNDDATQHKLIALAEGLAALMGELSTEYPALAREREELADAVGLEDRESSQ
ncbi:low affinity iron permease family protein [Nocardia caishijiensis]|uniref:Low affinity Fe/Cu permease n=1 Tax=Nocardia caishijiensis TaxID=184756 RepID=A0ABQ6YF73_9NOCA|nr:low affinity iron permease family protein [Nocardia caishijiensis]KAF0835751.1 low affinity Fe/Cu permease [Nocardia caishijiensis]